MFNLSPRQQLVRQLTAAPPAFFALEPGMFCPACRDALPVFVADELAGEDVDSSYPDLTYHLDICPACLHEYETLIELTATALFGDENA